MRTFVTGQRVCHLRELPDLLSDRMTKTPESVALVLSKNGIFVLDQESREPLAYIPDLSSDERIALGIGPSVLRKFCSWLVSMVTD